MQQKQNSFCQELVDIIMLYIYLMKQQNNAGKAHLRQIQRAWMRERDSECRAIVAKTVVGAGMAGDKCLADYTEDRALVMHTWLKQGKRF